MEDAVVQSKILFYFEQFWTFVAVSIGVALGGIAAKRLVAVLVPAEREAGAAEDRGSRASVAEIVTNPKLPTWYRIWRATISTHPVIVGGLAGLAPIPVAAWVPESTAAHVLWFALAGALSGQLYEISKRLAEIVVAFAKQRLGVKSDRPPPPADPAPSTHTDLADALEPEDKPDHPPDDK
jgi:hypothetical protein